MPVGDPGAPDDPIRQLLAGRYADPDTGEWLAAAARSVVIDDSLDGREADLVAALDLGDHLAVVTDDATFAALGHRVERALASRFTVQRVGLGRAAASTSRDRRPACPSAPWRAATPS